MCNPVGDPLLPSPDVWAMHLDQRDLISGTADSKDHVSARFLTDFFGALERRSIPVRELVGDLAIPLEDADVLGPVAWETFAEFMRRLGHATGGAAGMERCGETLESLTPSRVLAGLAGLAASPETLYRAAAGWVLRRALPGIETSCVRADAGQLEIHARLADGLKPCPEIFHFAAGGARVLPRTIGLRDAVVSSDIGPREARYRIALPPSATLFASIKRVGRTIFSAGAVLRFLEAQQLELHAKNDALQRANVALAESERRYRALTETAVDVVCELDGQGRVVYVSTSVEDLIGYSREQVTGSHYRLWFPRRSHERVDEAFARLVAMPVGGTTRERIRLHARSGVPAGAELTARTYDTPEGDRRIVMILRDLRGQVGLDVAKRALPKAPTAVEPSVTRAVERALADRVDRALPGPGRAWHELTKLLQSAREGFFLDDDPTELGRDDPDVPEVIVELDDAPDEVWVDEALFVTAVGAMLGALGTSCGRREDDEARALRLHTGCAPTGAGGERTLEVSVSAMDGGDAPPIRDTSRQSERALALAEKAARALGGRLDRTERIEGLRLALPQPPRT